ncbi:XrtN system VIT domain-containing protein [Rufibacter soli]
MNFEIQSTLQENKLDIIPQRLSLKPLLVTGLVCIVVSFSIFLLQDLDLLTQVDNAEGMFLFNYLIAAGYFLTILLRKRFSKSKPLPFLDHLMLFLVLGLISDFALNKSMSIFQPSVPWFSGWLVVVSCAMVAFPFRQFLPKALQYVMVFLLGTGVVLFGYFALYLLPFYAIGAVGAIALGIGLHIFIPLAAVLCLLWTARRLAKKDETIKRVFAVGVLVPVLFSLVYLSVWQAGLEKINRLLGSYQVQDQQDLPRWVFLSQRVPATPIFERLVQTDLVYQSASTDGFDFFGMPNRTFSELQRHDPLVMLATRLFRKPELTTQERIKIMESRLQLRHQAQERLWSGTHLSTSSVITQAQIFPQYRLSYTEKILNVYNNRPGSWGQEEAIYTFHLPEGSVVTSLSLWIKGQEEKGYLTTQSKAEKAYKTIVGVESRDPSVVHWQEGNTVSVRVFPCTPQESRQFKIGITSPLRLENGQLLYQNIPFDGPSARSAQETAVIRVEDPGAKIEAPQDFTLIGANRYERHVSFDPDWNFKLPAPPLSTQGFSFAGHTYQMAPYTPTFAPFSPTRIYLDLNKAWTEEEFTAVWQAAKKAEVFAFTGTEMTLLTDQNRQEIFRQGQTLTYSLFPLHLVSEPEKALIISKGTENSPNLKDLQGSRFADDFAKTSPQRQPIRFFQVGTLTSPYIKTLKELSVIQHTHGTTADLATMLRRQRFPEPQQNDNTVVLEDAEVTITRTSQPETDPTKATAPTSDHLLRLFAYNHLLQQIGPKYFQKEYLEEHLIEEATQANVVSPLSSLVVLETKEDYERFGITESKNSLGNASLKSSGAVPEPHEWVLIILVIVVVAFTLLKQRLIS